MRGPGTVGNIVPKIGDTLVGFWERVDSRTGQAGRGGELYHRRQVRAVPTEGTRRPGTRLVRVSRRVLDIAGLATSDAPLVRRQPHFVDDREARRDLKGHAGDLALPKPLEVFGAAGAAVV